VERNDYIQKPLAFDDQSLKLYSRFLSTHYGKPEQFTFDYIKWQYVENPAGRAVGYDAFYLDPKQAQMGRRITAGSRSQTTGRNVYNLIGLP
jgi:hypothetical protein